MMETRTNWGIVIVACVLAGALIGAALLTGYSKTTRTPTDAATALSSEAGTPPTSTDAAAEWRTALEAIATTVATSSNYADYRAPKELGATESIAQELFKTYLQLKKDGKLGTPAEDAALSAIIKRNAPVVAPTAEYTLGSLNISKTATLEQYGETIGTVINKASVIREYELTTFGKSVGRNNFKGTPELRAAAGVYRDIESDLVRAPVPEAMAGAHLTLIKNISFLAQATELLGNWTGDPVEAMAYIDAFVRADHDTQTAVNSLFSALINASKKV